MYEISTLKDLSCLKKGEPIFFDTETGGENFSSLVVSQIYQEHWNKVKVFIMKELPEFAPTYIWETIKKFKLVGHNLGYDLFQFHTHADGFEMCKAWEDTFYASRLVHPEWQEYTLDKCLKNVWGYDPYDKEGLIKKEMQKSFNPNEKPTHQQLIYASVDVLKLPKLYHDTKSIQGDFVYELDKKIAEYALTVSEVGMPVDTERLEKIEANINKELKANPININVNSYQQVRKLLGLENYSDELTLRMITCRPNGVGGFSGPTQKNKTNHIWEPNYIHKEEKISLAHSILEKRKDLKKLTFISRAHKNGYIDNNGTLRISSHFSPHAITGRVQGQEENLSQYPRTMKEMWGLPKDSKRVLLYADYSQLELRCIAAILPERVMEKAYREKIDLHTRAASGLKFDESLLPEGIVKRFVAKQLNFLALYGGGKANFQKTVCKLANVWLDMELVVSPAFDQWKKLFSGIAKWHKVNGKSKTYMDKTLCGRTYKAKKFTDLNSYRNQGSGAEIAKLAWHYMMKYKLVNDKNFMLNFVHDSYVLECDDDPKIYKPLARNMAICMQSSWFECTKLAPVKDLPMPVDVFVGKNWDEMEHETNYVHKYSLDGEYMYGKNIEKEIKW